MTDLSLHAKQAEALRSEATELLYGGAAGGGKSHLIRAAAILWASTVPGLQVYIFRRIRPDIIRNHMEGPTSFPAMLQQWTLDGWVRINWSSLSIRFWNGSAIHLEHCQYDRDRFAYLGADFHVLIIDELTTFSKDVYTFLRSRCRIPSTLSVPEEMKGMFPRILAGSNPGGIGHTWVKEDFITATNEGKRTVEDNGFVRGYLKSLLKDNPSLDFEQYSKALEGLGNPQLVKAMLEGSWDIDSGGMFGDVWNSEVHIIRPIEEIPAGWKIDRSFDWGSSAPFSVGWWAQTDGEDVEVRDWDDSTYTLSLPPRSLIRINEWYGWNGEPNKGIGLLSHEIAAGIKEREEEMGIADRVQPGPADGAIYTGQDGHNIAKEMARHGVRWIPASKEKGSRVAGWQLLRKMLKESINGKPPEEPVLLTTGLCTQFHRTIPTLPRDEANSDDVNTAAEDHIGDETRYRIYKNPKKTKKVGANTFAVNGNGNGHSHPMNGNGKRKTNPKSNRARFFGGALR